MGPSWGLDRRTATFVFGDVSRSRSSADDEQRLLALDAQSQSDLDRIVDLYGGERDSAPNDGADFVVVFLHAGDAFGFALDLQRKFQLTGVGVRMAIHSGDAERRPAGHWIGPALNHGARLCASASEGQVLVSEAAVALTSDVLPDGVSMRNLGIHRLRDLAIPEVVRQLCHPDLRADFAPLVSLDAVPNNLPVELTSFIGRDAEITRVGQLLDRHRLVTLTGAGGVGKTRLALHTVVNRVGAAPDGIWLVDLAAVSGDDSVPRAVAATLGVAETPMRNVVDAIAARLTDARALIVMDNCEHLLGACMALAESVLRHCPGVSIVATSREPLGLASEMCYRVPSLVAPTSDHDAEAESVRLFCERARAVQPEFALDAQTLPAVVAICRRLDGLPLAIELAAARTRAIAPAEIASQLEHRFGLLSRGRRAGVARQATLEASIRWSYDLLSDAEQTLLGRLSVFPGGFGLAAAARVAGGRDVEEHDVVDLLTSLVDRSMVHADQVAQGTQYRLLETVRAFANQRLGEVGEVDATRSRHLQWVVELSARLGPKLYGMHGEATRAELRLQLDNIVAALDWAIETGDAVSGLRIAAATGPIWGWYPGAPARYLTDVLALDGGDDRDRAHASVFASNMLGVVAPSDLAANARRLADALDDELLQARSNLLLAQARAFELDESAIDDVAAAVEELHRLADTEALCLWGSSLSIALMQTGDLAAAAASADRLLAHAQSARDPALLLTPAAAAATVACFRGDAHAAQALATQTLECPGVLSGSFEEGLARIVLAWGASAAGSHDAAVTAVAAELAAARRNGAIPTLAFGLLCQAWIAWRAGQPWDAALAAEVRPLYALAFPFGVPFLDALEAEQLLAAGDIRTAIEVARRAIRAADASLYAGMGRGPARRALARAKCAEGDLAEAETVTYKSLAESAHHGEERGVAESLDILATIAAETGAQSEAARLLGASDAVREGIGWDRGIRESSQCALVLDYLNSAIGAESADLARNETRGLTRDEAVAFATRGRGKRGRPTFGWRSLTPTELDVARLIADGLRNRDIAQRLLISEATVKTHLTHIYRKLGITNRAELAAQAATQPP